MQDITVFDRPRCTNCGEPLQGAFCHQCGQSMHSVMRPMHGLVEETFETLLHIDSRILHTLPKLFFNPGRLTLEYFAGRRVRYIAPFRLMFVLCLLAFFALHWTVDHASMFRDIHAPIVQVKHTFEDARTPEQVRSMLREQIEGLEQARHSKGVPALARTQIAQAEQALREQANKRLVDLGAPPLPIPAASGTPAADGTAQSPLPTHAATSKPRDSSAPAASGSSDAQEEHDLDFGSRIEANWKALKEGTPRERELARQHMIDGVFSTLPQALLLMSPLFALLLKLFYLFKRRLYMEHLIVSLHSHAFLFLSLLLITGVGLLDHWLVPHAAWLDTPLSWVMRALLLWIPVYLLWMQKRIYRQGWPATIWKFLWIGFLYSMMLMAALTVGIVLGMAH